MYYKDTDNITIQHANHNNDTYIYFFNSSSSAKFQMDSKFKFLRLSGIQKGNSMIWSSFVTNSTDPSPGDVIWTAPSNVYMAQLRSWNKDDLQISSNVEKFFCLALKNGED